MAEIEMEIEMTKPLEINLHTDDDFIDFDTDMVDQPELVSQHAGNNQELAEAISNAEVDADADVDAEISDHVEKDAGDATVREEEEKVELDVLESTASNTDKTRDPKSNSVEPKPDDTEDRAVALSQVLEEDDGYAVIAKDSDQDAQDAQDTTPHTHSSDHEIDYEFEEQSEQSDSHGELDLVTELNPVTSGADSTVEIPAEDAVSGDPEDAYSEHGGHDGHYDNQNQSDQEEITYDENDDVSDPAAMKDELSVTEGNVEGVSTDNLDEEALARDEGLGDATGEFYQQEAEEQTTQEPNEAENVELEEYGAATEAHDDQRDAVNLGLQDPLVSRENSTAASETEFPAITVQYKGDEFPCFSHSSDGFFTEAMILDETMAVVLSRFREELASEIAQEEELVFQVDELGLEYSEVRAHSITPENRILTGPQSCSQDSLSSVTLRQILEIFDLLVNNQDPDSSRTLYTYLFTKPSASKRLESLMESATAGKGLDEVIHLFESPLAAPASVLEANTADDGLEEHLNDYDSPANEVEGLSQNEKEHDVEYVAEDGVDLDASLLNDSPDSNEGGQDATDADYIEGNVVEPASEDANATNDEASDAPAVEDDVESNGKLVIPHPGLFSTCYYPTFCLCEACICSYIEEHDREEGIFRDALQGRRQLERKHLNIGWPVLRCAPRKHAHSNSDYSITFSTTEADQHFIAHEESESNPFMNLELDIDAEVDEEVDLEVGSLANEQNPIDPDVANAGATDTSTTPTLKDDDETVSLIADISADAIAAELQDTTEVVDEDDVGEIDWRDEPEADEEIQSPPSAVGKRARGDDEGDVEDEQDVKRRRP
ncbi:hypothetical protein B0J13DRAFT_519484 [Dactylonectria estremocensis]|uniref:Uncharacterized protein n=1 Tax=Dactylonectria estremocensis TaxID=1079267 RepID=A0A9P9JIE0_9HYPO|nr:hypothetical protein B0J13DRAFT_519484 [Dactylonectria estremocensis]